MKTIKYDCPICEKIHPVEIRTEDTTMEIKGILVTCAETNYYCSEGDAYFAPADLLDINLLTARDVYRTKKGLLTSQEIKAIRERYTLTQKEYALLLGWGEVTIQRYEKKQIQEETFDSVMRLTATNPEYTLELLKKHKDSFSPERYSELKAVISDVLKLVGNQHLKLQEIKNKYVDFDISSDANGYVLLNLEKVKAVIGYLTTLCNPPLYKVKLCKLLWYCDALFFKLYNKSMTGLAYAHLPLGAVPIAHDEILGLDGIRVNEELINGNVAYRVETTEPVPLSAFTSEELAVLGKVTDFFKGFNSHDIINYMHEETAYKQTDSDAIIPYSLAKEIRDF